MRKKKVSNKTEIQNEVKKALVDIMEASQRLLFAVHFISHNLGMCTHSKEAKKPAKQAKKRKKKLKKS